MKILRQLIVFVSITLSSSVFAADLKIGYVDVEKLLREAPQVELINKKMLSRFGDKKASLEAAEKEIVELQEKYKRNELVMTDDKLEELKSLVISKVQVYKQGEAMLQQEVATMRSQEVAELQKSIRGVINAIAKDDNYDLILSDGVLHANQSFNITETILKEMGKLLKS